ncbi:beta-lactamase/transpeptidase-like protein [Lineolata rhizophorae]|uniref:Beta-lactamase/transpeptidase-like protein n=1 Tax=Lineolata rhizophorae TaxID=578093 RepID=A0A6A6NYC6_9PEZI|nr:beta-lactamase/transpeptidase-like protein [Lineolata rhizophorae]
MLFDCLICHFLSFSFLGSLCFASVQVPLQHGRDPGTERYDPYDGPLDGEFEALVSEAMGRYHVPGISVSIVDNDHTYAKGYGTAVFPSTLATPETLYYGGSTTKSFVAAAIQLLIEDSANSSNPLRLRTPVSDLIREDFVLPDSYMTTHATFEDLLSHRTGMPRHDFSYGGANLTVRDIVRSLRHLPLTAQIRTEYQYCNMMYVTLQHIIETITGRWLGYFLRERVWDVLSMSLTFFSLGDAQEAEASGQAVLAHGYYWNDTGRQFVPQEYLDESANGGAGGVISNVVDYARYLRAMMDMDPRLLATESYNALKTPRSFAGRAELWTGMSSYSLGWGYSIYGDAEVLHHNGLVTGFATTMWYMPSRKLGMTVMANADMPGYRAGSVLAYSMLEDLVGSPDGSRVDWITKFDQQMADQERQWRNAKQRLFPDAPPPENAKPPTLQLSGYTGTFNHPGYQNITLDVSRDILYSNKDSGEHLVAVNLQKTWKHILDFEHISSDYFMARVRPWEGNPSEAFEKMDVFPAEFQIGVDGKVDMLGIAYEPKYEGKIWFKKIECGSSSL